MLNMQEIYEISAGVEYHLKQLEDFTDVLRDVKHSLDEIRHAQENRFSWELQLLKQEFADIKRQLKRHGLPESPQYEKNLEAIKELINSDKWPEAVPAQAICMAPEDMAKRAAAILDMVVSENLENRSFLDYGCGNGHVATLAHERKATSVGYDVDLAKVNSELPIFVADFEEVKKRGPYDVILLHDVLDHIAVIDPLEALRQVQSVLKPEGRVYVRNHPWSARHGGHLYEKINKAHLHLVLDEVELVRLGGYECEPNIKVVKPLDTYRHWFEQTGFQIKSEIPIREEIDTSLIEHPAVFERLKELWEDPSEMMPNMEIGFVEYILESNKVNTQQMI